MELEKMKNHKYREDIYGNEVIARWPDIDSDELQLLKLILKNELQILSHA
jgi:hypothetical protein